MDNIDVALLVLRIWAGLVIMVHGVNHARSFERMVNWFASKGFRQAKLNAALSAVFEIAVGVGLILGLLTGLAAAGLASVMVVAFWSIHRFAGFFVFHRPDEGYEYVLTLSVVALAIAVGGPGAVSIDAVIGIDLAGWAGAAVFAGGVLAAALQLAFLWRRPAQEEVSV